MGEGGGKARTANVPLSVIHGTRDPLTSPAEMRTWLADNPAPTEIAIEGAGHFAAASHGEEVWRAIGDIARRARARG